ncbi:L,D-transpeptidase family protein [Consotaella salsifontis]|uniref:L,D-peptidoglycan transpeptidase YkuD, ErfK/YbiS/YcfS/YnhG family n=1 Tax=Consotaella salsifontis TaxID=1365950 RepID=A0A1T4SIA3_9HYPH|nr:L,D-transpeptidase family protein [Consotaella salsifontis]SKA27876.1 L,D-peptidoglycan transpeptidase YkuD, ErfK/YbiS/YcfS/YnhG family [Consotaella salsifontis]
MKKNSAGLVLAVRRAPGRPTQGILSAGPLRLRCALGRSGIGSLKREGDGKTPRAALELLGAWWRADRQLPRPPLPIRVIRKASGWCDAPRAAAYNRPVRLPFPHSAETLWREDHLYDLLFVLDWNVRSRARGRGSAIFLHIARPGLAPTEGCVALAARDMARLTPHLRRGSRLLIL